MKNIKLILLLFVAGILATSCVDDTTLEDEIAASPNLMGFISSTASISASVKADSATLDRTVSMAIFGPTLDAVTSDATATIKVVEKSTTAIEGVHYEIKSNKISFGPDDNFAANFPVKLITKGIFPPLAENPVLTLEISNVTGGDGAVIASGNQVTVTLLYFCEADLAGEYVATNDFCNPTFNATITQNPDGSWYSTVADGGFLHTCTSNVTLLNYGSFNEVCGLIQPSADLRYGSLGIGTILSGTWDNDNGILIMQHSDTFFGGGPYAWESTYVKQ